MVDFSADIKIATSIEQGTVCLFPYGSEVVKNRFFIVLNSNPKNDTLILLTTVTSQVEKVRKRVIIKSQSPMTCVELSPSDCPLLSTESAIDCNEVVEVSRKDLAARIDNGGEFFFEKLPQTVIQKIKSGVMASTLVSQENKTKVI